MARNVVSASYVLGGAGGIQYASDRGVVYSNLNWRFNAPPDFTDAIITEILGVLGASRNTGSVICSDASGFSPRKLEFIRSGNVDGQTVTNSLSLAFPNREPDQLRAAAASIRDIINAVNPNVQVACIKLIGEEFPNLIEELRPLGTELVATTSSRGTGVKQQMFRGKMIYQSDVFAGAEFVLPFKMATDVAPVDGVSSPPTNVGGVVLTCLNEIVNTIGCGGGNRRNPRRYFVDLLVIEPNSTGLASTSESKEIPVALFGDADILECGVALASLPAALCIGYQGESFDRFHRAIADI